MRRLSRIAPVPPVVCLSHTGACRHDAAGCAGSHSLASTGPPRPQTHSEIGFIQKVESTFREQFFEKQHFSRFFLETALFENMERQHFTRIFSEKQHYKRTFTLATNPGNYNVCDAVACKYNYPRKCNQTRLI